MALSTQEQEYLDFSLAALPPWINPSDEFLHGAAKMFGSVHALAVYLWGQALIGSASGATATTPDWLNQHAIDRGTRRQSGEDDITLRNRLRNVPEALTRPSLLAAANAILAANGLPETAAMVELSRDAAHAGTYQPDYDFSSGGTFTAGTGTSMIFTPAVKFAAAPYRDSSVVRRIQGFKLNIGGTGGSAINQDGGLYLPDDAPQWTALLTGSTLANPTSLHSFQQASGNVDDDIGSNDLVPGGTPLYQVAVPGFSRFGIHFDEGSADKFTKTISAGTTPFVALVVARVTAVPAAIRTIMEHPNVFLETKGASGDRVARANATSQVDGTAVLNNNVHVFLVRNSPGPGEIQVLTELESITPVGGVFPGTTFAIGSTSGVTAPMDVLYVATWDGVSMSAADLATLLDRVLNGPGGGGNDGSFPITGLSGNGAVYTNASGVPGVDAGALWAVGKRDRRGNDLDGKARAFCRRGFRAAGSRPTIVLMLPYGTTEGIVASVKEMLRQKKAAGFRVVVERRLNP